MTDVIKEELIKNYSLEERIKKAMYLEDLTFEKMMPKVNEILKKPINDKNSLSRALNNGYGRGKRSNELIIAMKDVLGV